jgi:formylglycine-generating enzyme required for sulfatase activity
MEPDRVPPRFAALGFAVHAAGPTRYIVPPVCAVAAGSFVMGSDLARDPESRDAERPQHRATLPAYRIARYPVTVAEYACAVDAGALRQPPSGELYPIEWDAQLLRPDHPAVCVCWHDALAYAAWLAHLTAQPWRLATEVEWEGAARGADARIYPWGDAWDAERANTRDGGPGRTTPVGSYPEGAGPSGAVDLAGNVWEWTSSLYFAYPYAAGDGRERHDGHGFRVLRGGSWNYPAQGARTARRGNADPSTVRGSMGFRLVLADE